MGERADRDEIDAGRRDRSDVVEADAAGGFELRRRAGPIAGGDGGAEAVEVHVVEEQAGGAGGEGGIDLGGIPAFDLDRQAGMGVAGAGDRIGEAAGEGDVVLLDQDRVVEAHPVVLAAAGADRGLLERALANVISNAVRFSPAGSPPRITAGVVDGVVDIRVVDRGPGVSRADWDRLFKPFQRLGDAGQSEGVGLGLAVAKGFIEAMGGEIEADDTPGGGLTITARLRAAE